MGLVLAVALAVKLVLVLPSAHGLAVRDGIAVEAHTRRGAVGLVLAVALAVKLVLSVESHGIAVEAPELRAAVGVGRAVALAVKLLLVLLSAHGPAVEARRGGPRTRRRPSR